MEFCYARVGRGVPQAGSTDADGRDVRWTAYARAAALQGLLVGGYWRFFPAQDLGWQVGMFSAGMALAVGGPLPLPPMVDVEDADGLAPGMLTDWTIECLERVQGLTGVRPVLYTSRWFLANQLQEDRLVGPGPPWPPWPLALAAWTPDPAWPDPRAVFWQYAGNVTVPWASGRVDLQRHRGALT